MRRSRRLPDYDYSSNGAYFITIATFDRRPILVDEAKAIVDSELHALPDRFPGLSIDIAMIMPDHLHTILILSESKAAIPRIVQAFKSLTTRKVKAAFSTDRVWQRSYYDRVIRNEQELQAVRDYIQSNPVVHAVRVERTS